MSQRSLKKDNEYLPVDPPNGSRAAAADCAGGRAAPKTIPRSAQPPAKQVPARRTQWAPWMEVVLADWRARWPAAFTKPVPLALGISWQIKTALRAEGAVVDRKTIGVTMHRWTTQGAYLRAVLRGDLRRNLDGSAAGVPSEAALQYAQKLLDERAARQSAKVLTAKDVGKPV